MTRRTGAEVSRPRPAESLWTRWERTLHRIGDKPLLVEAANDPGAERIWTAPALHDAALAHPLPAGARPGDRIAFRLPNGPQWLALFLALQRAGLAALPLDAAMPDAGCVETARRLGARALFLGGTFRIFRGAPQRRERFALIKTTSGTTGLPQAVPCRAAHLAADGRNVAATMGIKPGDRNLAAIPFGHSYGLGNLVLPLLLQGTAVVCAGEFVPRQIVAWVRRHGVTVLPAVPALFRVLTALPEEAGGLAPLRLAVSAGAPLAPETARAFRDRYGVRVHNFYGSSETGGISYDRSGAASLAGRSVGKPLRGVAVEIAGGRITVSSAAVAERGGKRRLADRGEWSGRGELVLAGRSAPQAIIGGKKVHPAEVERALRALPGVSDAAVWTEGGGAKARGCDLLAAAVETGLPRAEVERLLARKLPAWKLPRRLAVAVALPRTARGKLDAAALRRL